MKVANDIATIASNANMTGVAVVDHEVGLLTPASELKSFLTLKPSDGVYYAKGLNTLVITKPGVTFDGYDFSGVSINVTVDNVTFKNSYFDASVGLYAINALPGTKNLTVDQSTFDGLKVDRIAYADFVTSRGENTVITNNAFLNSPTDAVSIVNGKIDGNYFNGAGYSTAAHSDAIWIGRTTGPVEIVNNVIDWRVSADAPTGTNNAVRITGEGGNVSDVLVQNNIILGGSNTVLVSNGATWTHTASQVGAVTGVKIVDNVVDYGLFGDLEQSGRPADMIYSNNIHVSGAPALAGNEVIGALPDTAGLNKIEAASAGSVIFGTTKGVVKGDYIVGGSGSNTIYGSAAGDVIVGGQGRDYIKGGGGNDVFVYNSLKDSGMDLIVDFTQGSDKVYLAKLDGAPTTPSGWQWLGEQRFTGHEWQMRATYASGVTTLEIDANGDLRTDFSLQFSGNIALKTSDFILVDRAMAVPELTLVNANASVKIGSGISSGVPSADGVLAGVSHEASVTSIAGQALGSIIQGLFGTLTMGADGSYTYTRTAGTLPANAIENFAYTAMDKWGQTAAASLTINVHNNNSSAPTISGDGIGRLTEGSSVTSASGVLSVQDGDSGDRLVVSVDHSAVQFTDASGADRSGLLDASTVSALKAGFALSGGAIGSNAGTAGWSYGVGPGVLDFLGRGESAQVVTSVRVDDGQGGTALKDVVVTLTGVDDAAAFAAPVAPTVVSEPSFSTGSPALVTRQGTVGFSDLDLTDVHSVSVSTSGAGRGYIGSLVASVTSDTTGGRAGTVTWTFSAPEKAMDFLGDGQSQDQTYTLALSDGKGGIVRQDVVVTLVGTDDLPKISGSSSASWYEGGATSYQRSGVLSFLDPDLTDHVTTSIQGQSVSYVTAKGVDMSSSLSLDQLSALKAAFSMPVGDLGSNKGSSSWTYGVLDKTLDFLGQNDVVNVVTRVKASDGHGGEAFQDVTITVKGINDAPVLVSPGTAVVAGAVAEAAGVSGSASLHAATGSFQFADADLSDAHLLRVTAKGPGYLGTFTPVVTQDTTGGGTGTVSWTFQVADKALDGLAAGQTVTQTYSVLLHDGKTGGVTQDIVVTLTGASDQFSFATPTARALPSFAAGDTLAVSASSFGGGLAAGALDASWFSDTAGATVSGHGQFFQDAAHKSLLWDADGTGSKAPVTIATFASAQLLHYSDIMVM